MPVLDEGTGHLDAWKEGCHVMQVGPMWQANGGYATKWQVGLRSVAIMHGVAVLRSEHAKSPHVLPLLMHISDVGTMSYISN